jgi:carboxypeptidase T
VLKLSRFLLSLCVALFLGNTAPISFKGTETQAAFPSGQNLLAGSLHHEQGFPGFFTPLPVPPLPNLPYHFVVVRAYYSDPNLVAELARWLEPWEVHSKEGYLVVGVTQAEYNRLLKMGFRLEVDQQLTDQVNRPIQRLPQQTGGIPDFSCYRTVAETYASAQMLVSAYPQLAAWIDIGDSWEKTQLGGDSGLDLMVLRLTNSKISGPKPKLFIMASIHAREYAPAELATRFAEYLLHNYNTDPDVTWLLDYQEIHLLLQSNPDGRKLAETRSPTFTMWRKNTNQTCYDPYNRGVDLNRNFEFQWGLGGASPLPCEETFMGASAASEPETQAIQSYVRIQFPDQRGPLLTDPAPITTTGVFIDLHSYGDLVLWPWGYTSDPAPNNAELSRLGQKFAFFNHYDPEQAIGLYPTSGTTDDFAYGDLGLAAYTFEVGANQQTFFPDCDYFNDTILPENRPALFYAAKAARSPYQTPAGPDVTSVVVSPTITAPGGLVQLTAQVDDTRYFTGTGQAPPPAINNILSAEYYIDAPPWLTATLPVSNTLAPLDGNFDQPLESVTGSIDTSSLGTGRHMLYLRARDTGGNWGPFTAAFLYIPTVFLPVISK